MAYEKDPKLLADYRRWLNDLWEMNWMEGNSLFTYMTLAFEKSRHTGRKRSISPMKPTALSGRPRPASGDELDPRRDIEINPNADRGSQKQSARPVPIDQRPLDNEYAWKGNPYQMDAWLLPAVRRWNSPVTIRRWRGSAIPGRILPHPRRHENLAGRELGLNGRARA